MKVYKACSLDLKDLDAKQGIVTFYAAAFDIKDSDGDIIVKGAFAKTIQENRKRIKHFKNHDKNLVPGVPIEITEDNTGLLVRSQLAKTTLGKDTLIEYESGIITEHSHGFKAIKEEQGKDANFIKESRLWEVTSLTAWGANEHTPPVGIKSEKEALDMIKSIDYVLRKTSISDERAKQLEEELNKLYTYIKSLIKEDQPLSGTGQGNEPVKKGVDYNYLLTNLKF